MNYYNEIKKELINFENDFREKIKSLVLKRQIRDTNLFFIAFI